MATDILASILSESLLDGVPCCGGSPAVQGLDIQLKYAIPRGITLSGFKLDVTLDVTNPNATSIHTTGFSYKIAQKNTEDGTEGAVFAEGSLDDGISLPGGATTQVVVPVSCSFGGVGSVGKGLWKGGGSIDFVMSGETHYKIPMTETMYTLPYHVEGQFSPTGASAGDNADEK